MNLRILRFLSAMEGAVMSARTPIADYLLDELSEIAAELSASVLEKPLLHVQRLQGDAILPTYATSGAAAFDIYAQTEGRTSSVGVPVAVCLGWACAVPKGHALLLTTRSGHRLKYGLTAVSMGVVDSDYRGEVMMLLKSQYEFAWKRGDRIAQGLIVPAPQYNILPVADLGDTARGNGGFGSTGE